MVPHIGHQPMCF